MIKNANNFEELFRKSISQDKIRELYDKMGLKKQGVDFNQFAMGIRVEMEHADITHGNPETTAKIAVAHLKEKSDYYTRLKLVEKNHD